MVLEEEDFIVEGIEGKAFGRFQKGELRLLGEDFVDVWC